MFTKSQTAEIIHRVGESLGKDPGDVNFFTCAHGVVEWASSCIAETPFGTQFQHVLSSPLGMLNPDQRVEYGARIVKYADSAARGLTSRLSDLDSYLYLRKSEIAALVGESVQYWRSSLEESLEEIPDIVGVVEFSPKSSQSEVRARCQNSTPVISFGQTETLCMRVCEALDIGRPTKEGQAVFRLIRLLDRELRGRPDSPVLRSFSSHNDNGLTRPSEQYQLSYNARLKEASRRLIEELNRHINVPFLSEGQESEVIRITIEALIGAVESGFSIPEWCPGDSTEGNARFSAANDASVHMKAELKELRRGMSTLFDAFQQLSTELKDNEVLLAQLRPKEGCS